MTTSAMLITHNGKAPTISPDAYVAPTATVCGDVTIGAYSCVMHGATIIAEGGSIEMGSHNIIMENAVVRSTSRHSLRIGNHCLVGPNSHLVGCTINDEVFVATGSAVFHSAQIGRGAEVRVNGVVHVKSTVAPDATVPIGWVAVGSPATILPTAKHEDIWRIQEPLNFPLCAYGLDRTEASMVKITEHLSGLLSTHSADVLS